MTRAHTWDSNDRRSTAVHTRAVRRWQRRLAFDVGIPLLLAPVLVPFTLLWVIARLMQPFMAPLLTAYLGWLAVVAMDWRADTANLPSHLTGLARWTILYGTPAVLLFVTAAFTTALVSEVKRILRWLSDLFDR